MTTLFGPHGKFLIEGTQQELETLHKALAAVVASTSDTHAQVITDKFNVIFRKRSEGNMGDIPAIQGALDDVDDGN